MPRDPVPTHYFALTVVHRGGRYLLVQEKKHPGWYLPAGRVEWPESLQQAAVRETREESGVDVILEGILRIEHSPAPGGARVRVYFVARPAPGSEPRVTDDNLGAAFLGLREIEALPLRGPDALAAIQRHASGARVLPLDAWVSEGEPW
jgi:phosphatase NudJ